MVIPIMDPVSAIEARIGAIEARFAALDPTPTPVAGGGRDFASVLTSATSQTPGTATLAASVLPSPALAPGWGLAPPLPLSPGTVGATPANRLAPGQYPRLSPPPELAVHGNGRVPPAALEAIDATGTHRLWGPAARAFRALQAEASAAGVRIGVTDSYRTLAGQERLAREKGLYRDGGLAAVPGTSNHGWGLAVDLDLDDAGQRWMRDNGWRFGFVEDVPREPWHWTYRPAGNGS